MKLTKLLTQQFTRIGLAAVVLSTLNLQPSTARAQGTAFSYQGVLNDGGAPATGLYDLEFRAFDAVSGGAQQGGTVLANDVPVTNGLFTTTLDFGAAVFTGPARWLNIAVRPGASVGSYANLLPRQPITASPYAVFAGGSAAAGVTGTLPDARLSANVALRAGGNALTGNQSVMSGNVGIGTTSPLAPLSFGSGLSNTKLALWEDGLGGAMGLGIQGNQYRLHLNNSSDRFSFLNGPAGTEVMSVRGNGTVGIGTTSPLAALSVGAGSLVDANVPIQTSTGGAGTERWMGVNKNGGYGLLLGYVNASFGNTAAVIRNVTTDPLEFWVNNGTRAMLINSSGNVGIGTTSPGAKLHIRNTDDSEQGGIRFERAATGNYWNIFQDGGNALVFSYNQNHFTGTGYAYLTSTTFGLISTSDRRAKKDIEVMAPCLDRVMALKPTTFRYKTADEGTPLNYGFIAQEIAEQFPDLVMERNGLKTLAAAGITAINTRAIQDLKLEKDAELAKLRAELSQLRSEKASLAQTVNDMQARFVRLEQAMNKTTVPAVKDVSASADVK